MFFALCSLLFEFITSTEKAFTGQRYDMGTGLLFYNARYYDASLARFVSADSIVPNTSHRSLTVDFHETGFNGKLAGENNQNFWFMMSSRERQNATTPWGPSNPQELNRFSYVNNNPLIYGDPSGHLSLSREEARQLGHVLMDFVRSVNSQIAGLVDPKSIAYVIKQAAITYLSSYASKYSNAAGVLAGLFASYILDLATDASVESLLGAVNIVSYIADGLFDFLASSSTTLNIYFATEAECVNSPTGLHCGFLPGTAQIRMSWSSGSFIIDGNLPYLRPEDLDNFYYNFGYYFGDCRPSNRSSCSNNEPKPDPKGNVPS